MAHSALTPSFRSFTLACCIVVLLIAPAYAQIINLDNTTAPPTEGVGHDYIKDFSETVNPANGSVSVRINIPLAPGRGLKVPFALMYSSSIAFPHVIGYMGAGGGGQWYSYNPGYSGGWSNSIPIITSKQAASSFYNNFGPWPPTTYSCTYIDNYVIRDWDGSSQPLNIAIAEQNTSNTGCDQSTYKPVNILNGGGDFFRASTSWPDTTQIPQTPTAVTVADAEERSTVFLHKAVVTPTASPTRPRSPQTMRLALGIPFWAQFQPLKIGMGTCSQMGQTASPMMPAAKSSH